MAWPGLLTEAQANPGLPVPCPELGLGYWFDGVDEPVDPAVVVSDDLDVTVRTIDTESGTALVSAAMIDAITPALQVQIIHQGVWDQVLVDS